MGLELGAKVSVVSVQNTPELNPTSHRSPFVLKACIFDKYSSPHRSYITAQYKTYMYTSLTSTHTYRRNLVRRSIAKINNGSHSRIYPQ